MRWRKSLAHCQGFLCGLVFCRSLFRDHTLPALRLKGSQPVSPSFFFLPFSNASSRIDIAMTVEAFPSFSQAAFEVLPHS